MRGSTDLQHSKAFMALSLVALFCTGCGCAERHVESKVADALQQRLGPAKSYDDIVGKDIKLEKGIKLASLNVTVYDLIFDTKTQEIKNASKTSFSATIDQDELEKYLQKSYPDVPDLKISLRNGIIDVSAKPAVAGVGVNVKTEAALQVKNHHLLILDLKKISAAGVPAPEFARNYIETKVNPVFDSKDLGFNATISSLELKRGLIGISGDLELVSALT
jgi:hypothetical protein